jgi:hypothetical protein
VQSAYDPREGVQTTITPTTAIDTLVFHEGVLVTHEGSAVTYTG